MGRELPESSLADLLTRHIDDRYGGNQAALARALGISPQHLGALICGKIRMPRADLRHTLARELGVSPLQILVLTGEVDRADVEAATLALPPEAVRIVRLLRDPRLGPAHLASIEATVRAAVADAPSGETADRHPDAPAGDAPDRWGG
jgi:transcriptional regulator with XRE-family HTH domain